MGKSSIPQKVGARQVHAPATAILLVLGAYLCWMVHDTIVKLLTAGYSVPQILFFGRVLAVPLSLYLSARTIGRSAFRVKWIGLHLLRAISSAADMVCFVSAIALTSLANVTTITFSSPLIMAVLSAVLLHETVGWRRWMAVLVGFLGVIVVLQPSGAGLGLASFLALGSAVAYAVYLILTRLVTRHEPVPVIVLWNSGLVIIFVALWMVPFWKTPSSHDWWMFATIAVTGVIGQYAITEGFRLGEASLLAPLQYTSLIWAALFGYLVFGDIPTLTLWVGAAIIILSTIYLMHHERRGRTSLKRGRAAGESGG